MASTSRMAALWRNLFRRDRVERDLADEMRAMFELVVAGKIRAGLPPDEARRMAAIEFGSVEAIKEQVRDVKRGALLDALLRDVRFGARLLRRSPVFAATA